MPATGIRGTPATVRRRGQVRGGDGRHSGYNLLNEAASAVRLEAGLGPSMGFVSLQRGDAKGEQERKAASGRAERAPPERVEVEAGQEIEVTSTPFGGVSTSFLAQMPDLPSGARLGAW